MTQTDSTAQPLLEVRNLETGYGNLKVLHGISLDVGQRDIVALVGPNGSGKSTTLKAIFGLLPAWSGTVSFDGSETQGRNPILNVEDGLCYVPQGSRVFTDMTVQENLEMGAYTLQNGNEVGRRLQHAYSLFPRLEERKRQLAGKLSGGEKQILALARALMVEPRLLLLDEPSLGLSPQLAKVALETVMQINRELGTAILIVEQNVKEVLTIAQRVYVLKLGRIALHDTPERLTKKGELRKLFLD